MQENVSSSSVAQTPLLSASAEVNLLQKQIGNAFLFFKFCCQNIVFFLILFI